MKSEAQKDQLNDLTSLWRANQLLLASDLEAIVEERQSIMATEDEEETPYEPFADNDVDNDMEQKEDQVVVVE